MASLLLLAEKYQVKSSDCTAQEIWREYKGGM